VPGPAAATIGGNAAREGGLPANCGSGVATRWAGTLAAVAREVYLIRHGQSTFNELFGATSVDPLHFDARLSPLGESQVAETRAEALGLDVDAVVVSPLTRAVQTALGLFDRGRTPFHVSALHRELLANSCDVGRAPNELAVEFPMLDFDHLEHPWWYDHHERDERGIAIEPDHVVQRRIAEFTAWVRARPEWRLAVVGHGVFFSLLVGRHLANCEIAPWRP